MQIKNLFQILHRVENESINWLYSELKITWSFNGSSTLYWKGCMSLISELSNINRLQEIVINKRNSWNVKAPCTDFPLTRENFNESKHLEETTSNNAKKRIHSFQGWITNLQKIKLWHLESLAFRFFWYIKCT